MEKLSSEVKNFTRNPLGVIGLFIFLVHAVGAGILGMSIDKLAPHNQSLLVFFVIVFPFIVLGFFGWMLSCHHDKLYGPGDFRSDNSYLEYTSRSNVGWRAAADLTQAASSAQESAELDVQPTSPPQDQAELAASPTENETARSTGNAENESAPTPASAQGTQAPAQAGMRLAVPDVSALLQSHGARVQAAYLAESLVFNELERETGAAVRRNIRIKSRGRSIEVDGLLEGNGQRTAVEVQFVTSSKLSMRMLSEKVSRLEELRNNPDNGIANVTIAFVVNGRTLDDLRRAREVARAAVPSHFTIRFYSFESLLADYALQTDATADA